MGADFTNPAVLPSLTEGLRSLEGVVDGLNAGMTWLPSEGSPLGEPRLNPLDIEVFVRCRGWVTLVQERRVEVCCEVSVGGARRVGFAVRFNLPTELDTLQMAVDTTFDQGAGEHETDAEDEPVVYNEAADNKKKDDDPWPDGGAGNGGSAGGAGAGGNIMEGETGDGGGKGEGSADADRSRNLTTPGGSTPGDGCTESGKRASPDNALTIVANVKSPIVERVSPSSVSHGNKKMPSRTDRTGYQQQGWTKSVHSTLLAS